jgi:hypothetical protein
MFILVLIMMPLATTEIGTDGWITGIMEGIAEETKFHPGWILVYTSAIMMVLRFFAGPIVHSLSPLGLLALSALLAIVGLYTLSFTTGLMIFGAATLYGFGKTFFWPTMLGVVAEQCPKGGALTLNAISGIGMLAVGTLGTTYIGALQEGKKIDAVLASGELTDHLPGLVENGKLTVTEKKEIYEIIKYDAISDDQVAAMIGKLPEAEQEHVQGDFDLVKSRSSQGALASMTMFPIFMLIMYIGLIGYFSSKGGYKPVEMASADGKPPED